MGGAADWFRLPCDVLRAPCLTSLVTCLELPHSTPCDLSAPTASAPPAPAPSPCCCLLLLPACLPACLRHLIQGQPGLPPPGLLRAVTHSPCRLSASMSSPRICGGVGLRQVLGNKLRYRALVRYGSGTYSLHSKCLLNMQRESKVWDKGCFILEGCSLYP